MKREFFLPVPGWERYYAVSNFGNVFSLPRKLEHVGRRGPRYIKGRMLRVRPDKKGYSVVDFSRDGESKIRRVARLVASAFVPNPQGYPEVNHSDGNKSNNTPENLEWMTRDQNMAHAAKNGLMRPPCGERGGNAKLTRRQARVIKGKTDWRKGDVVALATRFGVNRNTISRIKNGETWRI